MVAWAPYAYLKALRLNARERFDCVITSSPPESVHFVGRALRRRGVPWVADLRDGWTFEPIRPGFPTGLQRRYDERLERRWLGDADAVVAVSRPAADDLRDRLGLDPKLIPNGWDPDLADRARPDRRGGSPARHRTDLARLHRALRELRPRPGRADRGPAHARDRAPGRGGQAGARDRRAADRRGGRAHADRRLPRANRRRGHPRANRRAGSSAGRRRAAPPRLVPPHPAPELQGLRVPGRRAPDPRPRRRNGGRAGRRRGGRRGGSGGRPAGDRRGAAAPGGRRRSSA